MTVNLYKPKVLEFETMDIMYRQVCDIIEDKIHFTQQDKGIVRLLLGADTSCIPIYKKLSHSGIIDWQDVELYQTDEKYIPATDPESKQNIIATNLAITDATAGNYFFDTQLILEKSLNNYNLILDTLDGVFFDQGIISLGINGTIASLFGGENQLKLHSDYAIATKSNETLEEPDRLSLTPETLLNTENLYIILTGETKRQILLELVEGNLPVKEFPAKILLTHPNVTIFCCFD